MLECFSLILLQIAILVVGQRISSAGNAGSVLHKYFHPHFWLSLFYFLFFLLPQIYGVFNGFYIVGYGVNYSQYSYEVFISTQLYLVGFLIAYLLGLALLWVFIGAKEPTLLPPNALLEFGALEKKLLYVCFGVGLVGLLYLAKLSFGLDGFRSELVKRTDGLIATSLSFYANFAFAVLLAAFLVRRRWLYAVGIFSLFAPMIVATGARGRLLWPILIAYVLFVSARNRLRLFQVAVLGFLAITLLVVLDPLRATMLEGTPFTIDTSRLLESLFYKRNFDGFANFALIVNEGGIAHSLLYLLTGARDIFMETFYYSVYSAGVGFGVSVPGWFYIAGGLPGLLILAFFAGVLFAGLNKVFRSIQSRWLVFSYLFAMIWLAAVGGNFVESMDKMIVAASPGLLIYAFLISMGRRERPLYESPSTVPEFYATPASVNTPDRRALSYKSTSVRHFAVDRHSDVQQVSEPLRSPPRASKGVFGYLTTLVVRGVGAIAISALYWLISRVASVETAAVYFFHLTAVSLLLPILQFGMQNFMVSQVARQPTPIMARRAFSVCAKTYALYLLGSACLFGMLHFALPHFEGFTVRSLVAVCILIPATGFLGYYLQARERFNSAVTIINIVFYLIAAVLILWTALQGGIEARPVGEIVFEAALASFAVALVSVLILTRSGDESQFATADNALSISFPIGPKHLGWAWLVYVFVALNNWGFQLVLYELVSAEVFAGFSLAQRLAVLVSFPLIVTNFMLAPRVSRLFHEGRLSELKALASKATKGTLALAVPIFVIVFFAAEQVISLFSASYADVTFFLMIFAIAQLVNVLTGASNVILNMSGNSRLLLACMLAALLIGALDVLILYSVDIGLAFAVGVATTIAMQNVLAYMVTRRLLSDKPVRNAQRKTFKIAKPTYTL